MERLIEAALIRSQIAYFTEGDKGTDAQGLDFYLPEFDLFIEVKQFYSPRIADQMAKVKNVIAAQGRPAVERLARMIELGLL